MANTPETTPAFPDAADTNTTLRSSLFKSLHLAIDGVQPENPPPPIEAPVSDGGVIKETGIDDFSEHSGSLGDMVNAIEKRPAPPVDDTVVPPNPSPLIPPVAATPPTEPAPVTPSTEPAPVAVTPKPELPKITVPQLPSLPSQEPVGKVLDVSKLDLSGLDEDEIDEVKTAAFAEQKYPERYRGQASKVLDYIKKHKAMHERLRTESPDGEVDEDNTQYRAFVKANKPTLTDGERRRLARERVLEEAAAMAEERMQGKQRKLEEELTHLKAAPVVERTINDFKSLVKTIMPKEDDPLVTEHVEQFSKLAEDAGREFLLLSSQLTRYDAKNGTHKWLAEFIQEQGDLFVKSGHEALKRGRKTFLPRAKFNALPSDQRDSHFTFSDDDVMQLLAVNAKSAVEFGVNKEREKLKRYGYARQAAAPATPATPAAPVAPPPASPRATPSVSTSSVVTPHAKKDPFMAFLNQ